MRRGRCLSRRPPQLGNLDGLDARRDRLPEASGLPAGWPSASRTKRGADALHTALKRRVCPRARLIALPSG